jgi:hypothetical protein
VKMRLPQALATPTRRIISMRFCKTTFEPFATSKISDSHFPAAEAKLREAQNAHRIIEAEVKQSQVNELVLKRIAAAQDADAGLTAACEALRRYLDVGAQIYALTDDLFGSRRDDVEGWNRIAKSLPAPFADLQKRQPGVFLGGGPKLADAEASYWNVSIIKRDAA